MISKTKKFFNGHKAYDELEERPYSAHFIFSIDTMLKTEGSNRTFYMRVAGDYSKYNCTIHWGDGTTSRVNSSSNYTDKVIRHEYPNVSSYTWTITIVGQFAGMTFSLAGISDWDLRKEILNSAKAIVSLDNWGTSVFYYVTDMFDGCRNMEPNYPYNQPPNTSLITDFSQMFRDCNKWGDRPLDFDTSKGVNFYNMFGGNKVTKSLANMSLDSAVSSVWVLGEMTFDKGGVKSLDETLIAWANKHILPYGLNITGNRSSGYYKYSKRAAEAYKFLTEGRRWTINAVQLVEWEFEDPVVREKMFQVFGSEIITEIQADTVTSMEGWFKDSDIVSFDEIGAFKNLENLDNTFEGCSLLTSVGEIPKKVTSMKSTFANCTSLVSVAGMPTSLINLDNAFVNCINLTEDLTIAASVLSMRNTFNGAISIEKLYMSGVNPPVYEDTLLNTDLDSVYVPGEALSLYRVFEGWDNHIDIIRDIAGDGKGIERVVFADAEAERVLVDKFDFRGQGYLSERDLVEINSLQGVFKDNKLIETFIELELFPKISSLYQVFSGCSNLKTVTIPNRITSLEYAFQNCESLIDIQIPDSITEFRGAFQNCGFIEAPVLPIRTTELYSTFRNCKNLLTVDIPKYVTSLEYTFYGCSAMKALPVIPSGVTALRSTFENCTSLTSVTIPRWITSLTYTFSGCTSLVNLPTIPESVKSLHYTFVGIEHSGIIRVDNCTPVPATDAFGDALMKYIYLPSRSCRSAYELHSDWKKYKGLFRD